MANCILPYANGNITADICSCNGGYTGDDCRDVLGWWIPMQWVSTILLALVSILLTVWTLLKVIHVCCIRESSSKRWNLATFSVVLSFLGSLRFVIYVLPSEELTMEYTTTGATPVLLAITVINGVTMAFYFASFAIVIAFWVQIFRAKTKVTFGPFARVVCIIAAVLPLGIIPGIIVTVSVPEMATLGIMIVLTCYILECTMFTILAIYLRVEARGVKLSKIFMDKKDYAMRFITAGVVGWWLAVFFGGMSGVFSGVPNANAASFAFHFVGFFFDILAFVSTIMLTEYEMGPRRLIRSVFCGDKLAGIGTTAPSTNMTIISSKSDTHHDSTDTNFDSE